MIKSLILMFIGSIGLAMLLDGTLEVHAGALQGLIFLTMISIQATYFIVRKLMKPKQTKTIAQYETYTLY